MKLTRAIVNGLIVSGATARLEELNREREALIKVIQKFSPHPIKLKLRKRRKRVHWTQLPKNRAKMLKNIKRMKRAQSK